MPKTVKEPGLPPGTLVYVGKKKVQKVQISIIDYTESKFQEKTTKRVEDCFPFKDQPTVTWVNINGLHDTAVIRKIGDHFNLHPLILEDILDTGQRPKFDDFEKYIFVVLKMAYFDKRHDKLTIEQVSLIIGNNFVISFQEREGDVFDPVRERLRKSKGRIRKMGSDYLAYALIDAIVDHYFIMLESIGDRVEDLEEELTEKPSSGIPLKVNKLKHELIFLKKSIWPLREVLSNLLRGESNIIQKSTGIYLKDVYDHTIQVIETVETYRDMVSGLHDVYLSTISNRMNEVMKVLTIFASIFIPLTFIAGIYGMNFQYMPELAWKYAYPILWVIIIAVGLSMFFYFRKKQWI